MPGAARKGWRLRALRTGLLALVVGAGCSFWNPDLTEPRSVPEGFQSVPANPCGVAFPADWKRDVLVEGELRYEGSAGRGSLTIFTELEAQRPDEPLPQFVRFYTKTDVQVTARETVTVPGADAAFRLRLSGADGTTHLVVYGYDAEQQKGCWVLATPADQTAEQIAETFTLEG
jgi:hypothetical protein